MAVRFFFLFFFLGGGGHRLLQKMIEGCSLLINTIPELMEQGCLQGFSLFPPPSCPELHSSCHNYSSSGAQRSRRLPRDAASLDVYCRLASPQTCLIRPPSPTLCGGLCNLPTMCLSSSPPNIIVCQFLSSGDVGPFPITETQMSRIMAPSCREESGGRDRGGVEPLLSAV